MYYTQDQLRDTVGISKETFCHWKRVLPMFSTGGRRTPSFSPDDVLATVVLQRFTETFGIRISRLADVSPGIFDICNQTSWDVLANRILVLDLSKHECLIVAKYNDIPINNAVVLCPLGSLITALQDYLLRSPRSSAHKSLTPATRLGLSLEVQGNP